MTFGQTPHGGGPFPNPRLWISRRTRVGVRGEQLLVWDNKATAGWWEGHPKGDGKAWLPRVTGRPLEELPQMQSLAAHPAAKLTPLSRLLVRNPLGDLCPHVDVDAEEGGGWGRETPCQAAVAPAGHTAHLLATLRGRASGCGTVLPGSAHTAAVTQGGVSTSHRSDSTARVQPAPRWASLSVRDACLGRHLISRSMAAWRDELLVTPVTSALPATAIS